MKEERNISKEIRLYENGRFMSVTIFLQMELDRTICRSPLTLSLWSTICYVPILYIILCIGTNPSSHRRINGKCQTFASNVVKTKCRGPPTWSNGDHSIREMYAKYNTWKCTFTWVQHVKFTKMIKIRISTEISRWKTILILGSSKDN